MKPNNSNKKYRDVAKLHMSGMRNGFLPTLGLNFLMLMYRCIDEAEDTALITLYDDEKLQGFVCGTLGKRNTYLLMLKYPFKLFINLSQVLISPIKLFKVCNLIIHMRSVKRNDYPKEELLAIVVDDSYRRAGIAVDLYDKLITYFQYNKVNRFSIIVGKELSANLFYKKMGAGVSGEIEVHKGTKSYVYTHEINI